MKKWIYSVLKLTRIEKIKIAFIFFLLVILSVGAFISIRSSINDSGRLVFANTVPQENAISRKYSYLSGQVENPGVYEIEEGMIIADLINLAGGFTKDADPEFVSKEINLSGKLQDEQRIYIPSINESAENKTTSSGGYSTLININTASLEELDTLSGIGPATAQKIIDARPFANIEDVMNVSGIGENKFNQIKDFITVK
jgi:competence protein ComEA